MQVQDIYQPEVAKIFENHNVSNKYYLTLAEFLKKECKGQPNNLRRFLVTLQNHPPTIINFNTFSKIVRIIKKITFPMKNEQLLQQLSNFLVSHSKVYFPYSITQHNSPKFARYLTLFDQLPVTAPQNLNDQKAVMIFLSKKIYSQEWTNRLIELINNQVLVDKKNQQAKSLKVNTFFSEFLVVNFDKLIPQLERLLVRSESNIDVWQEFISSVDNWKGIDHHVVPLISKIKHLFISNAEISIKIVNSFTKNLNDQKSIKESLNFVSGLIGAQHNSKKKIIYVRMLQGIIQSISKHTDEKVRNDFGQQLLIVLINSLIKFTEEEEFNVLTGILDTILPFVTDPKEEVAKATKLYIKNQNKYILILIGLILAKIYKKEHINIYPSLKQIFTHFKSQLAASLKKVETNWQWLLPFITFLSEEDSQLIDNLSQSMPLFKISCLSLSNIEKKNGLQLIIRYIAQLKSEEQQISNNIYVISALLLEQIKQKHIWQTFIGKLSSQQKIGLISRGIYPLMYFNCSQIKKNRGNNFNSLLLFIWQTISKQTINVASQLDFARIVVCYSNLKPLFFKNIICDKEAVNTTIQRYVKSSLFDYQNDQDNTLSDREKIIIDKIASSLLIYRQNYLINLLQQFTKEQYYKKNLQFLNNFESSISTSIVEVKTELQQIKGQLIQRGIHKPEQVKPKRIYIGLSFEVKMMSEQQVKEEKYRRHFLKMLSLFDKIIAKFLQSLNSHDLLNALWHNNLTSLLSMTKFPEHRLSIMKLVKKSLIFTAWQNKSYPQSKIFSKHSQFIGQFFALRCSGITPSVKLMGHCQHFLKDLLLCDFQAEQSNCKMLQNLKAQFVMYLANNICEYLLQNMQFDVNLKKLAIRFYFKIIKKNIDFNNENVIFTQIVKNINILTGSQQIRTVLSYLLVRVSQDRIKQLFEDILNFIQATKKLILHTITLLESKYKPEFEEYIKLKILSLEHNQDISTLADRILATEGQMKHSILTFNMKNFVKKNSKETIQKLCQFIKEQISAQNCEAIFKMVIKASEQLFDEGFDQQGLQMFPYFLTINIESISQTLYKPVFELLITKFTAKEQFGTLSKLSVEIGINIIKKNAKQHAEKLLLVLQGFINKASGVSNIIYLGVLAPYLEGNKNLQMIEKRITQLFKSNKPTEQKAISKCMPDLMSFFKKPEEIVQSIFTQIGTMTTEQLQVGQSYLFSGLLKGIGYKTTQQYLDKILASTYITKSKLQKSGRIYLINALVQNFGRVVELKGIKIIQIMIAYMADNSENIRDLAREVGQSLIVKMSSFSVKILLPQLLKGLEEEQNWRVKISYIWILGIMANCSAKQLQTSLPIIVPTLSTCLSNAHPTIREKASQALNLIGQTIKNPQVSQCVDTLIEALENPFENSQSAIDILLKTNFNHYIDPPALSMIIPILDYCMRGRVSELKAGACQVIGSIVELIANPYDLLPYLRIITTGLKVALCDPLPEIRCIAAMAIGMISNKIGIKQAELYFKFVLQIIESVTSNTTERQGAAQAHAEIICSHTYEYFEESLNKIFDKLNCIKHSQKEGYILVFLYVPAIKTTEFQGFIKEVNENMYCFVSDEDENIRNSAMMVEKVLISNYCLSHTDLLLGPLCDGIFQTNWKKRNAAIILIGELLNIIKSHMYNTRSTEKAYAYYKGIMAVYIIKDDQLQMTRQTANQVWNTYIQNTPKTIKMGLTQLVRMWTRWTHCANGVVFKNIVAFSSKYGQNFFSEILDNIVQFLKEPEHQVGCFEVLSEFLKRLNNQFLGKQNFKETIRNLYSQNLFTITENVRLSLANSLALYVDKMHEERFFQQMLYPTIQKMDKTQQSSIEYTNSLHLLKDLLKTNSNKVVDRVINKIMEHPMSQFKIEVITNNADRLANFLYTHFKRPATQVLVEEIYTLVQDKSRQNRLSLIIYCLEQVSLQLSPKHKGQFIQMINQNIYKLIFAYSEDETKASSKRVLVIFINMLIFFLNSTALSEIDQLDTIIGQLSPLIFFSDPNLKSLGHKIFLLLISDIKNVKTSEYLRQMVVSFENKLTSAEEMIWQNEQTFHDYVNILVKALAYGNGDIMQESLDMVDFIMKHTTRPIIQKQILRIVGPIIRISNYPLLQKQKVRIMELLIEILKQHFKIDAYINQILSVCLRLLQEFKNSEEVMRIVGETYLALLTSTSLRQQLILTILSKLKTFGANLVHSFYYLVKSIILQKIELPKNIYDKIIEECNGILVHNQGKLPVKAAYYASKISARIGIFLNKPIQKIEIQLTGLTCPYETVINYLHYAYYKKIHVKKLQTIQIFIKESNRQKVHYLLKSLKLCIKNSEQARKIYSQEYIKSLVPETLIGFDDISQMIDYFDSEKQDEFDYETAEININ